jgi:hypothetical protein
MEHLPVRPETSALLSYSDGLLSGEKPGKSRAQTHAPAKSVPANFPDVRNAFRDLQNLPFVHLSKKLKPGHILVGRFLGICEWAFFRLSCQIGKKLSKYFNLMTVISRSI